MNVTYFTPLCVSGDTGEVAVLLAPLREGSPGLRPPDGELSASDVQ